MYTPVPKFQFASMLAQEKLNDTAAEAERIAADLVRVKQENTRRSDENDSETVTVSIADVERAKVETQDLAVRLKLAEEQVGDTTIHTTFRVACVKYLCHLWSQGLTRTSSMPCSLLAGGPSPGQSPRDVRKVGGFSKYGHLGAAQLRTRYVKHGFEGICPPVLTRSAEMLALSPYLLQEQQDVILILMLMLILILTLTLTLSAVQRFHPKPPYPSSDHLGLLAQP